MVKRYYSISIRFESPSLSESSNEIHKKLNDTELLIEHTTIGGGFQSIPIAVKLIVKANREVLAVNKATKYLEEIDLEITGLRIECRELKKNELVALGILKYNENGYIGDEGE